MTDDSQKETRLGDFKDILCNFVKHRLPEETP